MILGQIAYTAYAKEIMKLTNEREIQTVMRRWDNLDVAIREGFNAAAIAVLVVSKRHSKQKKDKLRRK